MQGWARGNLHHISNTSRLLSNELKGQCSDFTVSFLSFRHFEVQITLSNCENDDNVLFSIRAFFKKKKKPVQVGWSFWPQRDITIRLDYSDQ